MISAKKGIFYIRDRTTGEFEPVVAIKGEKGDAGELAFVDEYFSSETGDSEELVMTQKGVTDLHTKIVSGETVVGKAAVAETAENIDHADKATKDANGLTIHTSYARTTAVNGKQLNDSLLETAEAVDVGIHQYHLTNTTPGDDLPNAECKTASATIYKRSNTSILVVIWATKNTPIYYNNYNSDTWKGWRSVINSSNIGSQSVSHANTATYLENNGTRFGRVKLWEWTSTTTTMNSPHIIKGDWKSIFNSTGGWHGKRLIIEITRYISISGSTNLQPITVEYTNPFMLLNVSDVYYKYDINMGGWCEFKADADNYLHFRATGVSQNDYYGITAIYEEL